MIVRLTIIALAVTAALNSAIAGSSCSVSKRLVGPCFSVRGELVLANGTPGIRIWRIGTERILGVLDSDGKAESSSVISPNVQALLKPDGLARERPVYGDYKVCPLSKERPGWMQMVCISQASNLFAPTRK